MERWERFRANVVIALLWIAAITIMACVLKMWLPLVTPESWWRP